MNTIRMPRDGISRTSEVETSTQTTNGGIKEISPTQATTILDHMLLGMSTTRILLLTMALESLTHHDHSGTSTGKILLSWVQLVQQQHLLNICGIPGHLEESRFCGRVSDRLDKKGYHRSYGRILGEGCSLARGGSFGAPDVRQSS